MKPVAPKPQHCAIYTRKSTEHNLDLAFNSLDAQREACEASLCEKPPSGSNGSTRSSTTATAPQTLHFPADDLQTADRSFNTPVGNELHQGYQNVDRVRNPCIKEREQDAGDIEHRRNLALEVTKARTVDACWPIAWLNASDRIATAATVTLSPGILRSAPGPVTIWS